MIQIDSFVRDLQLIKERSPLIHNITNYVVMNNTANALLAIGASPVMAHAVSEVADMVDIASALVINIGTLDEGWVESMTVAGKRAAERRIPIVLDPVGAGATPYRTEVSKRFIDLFHPAIIRGNASEIMALCQADTRTKGVDSLNSSDAALQSARQLAQQTGAVVVVSGERDYITDGAAVQAIDNGSTRMPQVTGMGCTATALVAAFHAINSDALTAATHAMALMGIAGEIAAAQSRGNGSLQMHFLDELCLMNEETIRKHLKQTDYDAH